MGQQLGQLHRVPGATAAPRLLEGVGAPFVGVKQDTKLLSQCCSSTPRRSLPSNCRESRAEPHCSRQHPILYWKPLEQANPNLFPPILSGIVEVMDGEGG
jgi:hypothetical protein